MEQKKISPEFYSTGLSKLEMVSIGEHGFLFDKKGLSVRKKILYENNFKKVEFKDYNAKHLDFSDSFTLKGKILKVTAEYYTSYGPLGDRINVDAKYDGEVIGNYRSLRSYMGGGANGKWPILVKDDCQLIFTLQLQQSAQNNLNHFSIHYFETLIPFSEDNDEKKNFIKEESINLSQLEQRFSVDEIVHSKVLSWEHQIIDDNGNDLGKLSCFCYPGYQRYQFNRYGKIDNLKEHLKRQVPFISREIENSGCLYALEFQTNNGTETHFPWGSVSIYGSYD